MAAKLGRMVTYIEWLSLLKVLEPLVARGLAKSRGKLTLLNLSYHSAYGYHIWQGGDLL